MNYDKDTKEHKCVIERMGQKNVGQGVGQDVTLDVTLDVTGVTGRSKKKERLKNVLKTLLANRQLPQDGIAKLLGVSRRTIIRDFNALRLTYRIEWIGGTWDGHWEIEKLS